MPSLSIVDPEELLPVQFSVLGFYFPIISYLTVIAQEPQFFLIGR